MTTASGLQCGWDDAFVVNLDRHDFCTGGAGGIAKAGIGQFLDQDDGPLAMQAAIEDQRYRVLPAMGQRDVIRRDRAKDAVAHPGHDRGPQGGFTHLAGVPSQPCPVAPAMSRRAARNASA